MENICQMSDQRTAVLIIVSNLEYGGAQRQIVELVNNIDTDRYRVDIASLSDYVPLASQLNPETVVHIVQKKSRFDFTVVFKLLDIIRNDRYQILHSYLFDAEIAARLAGRLSKLKPRVIGAERNTDYEFKKVQLLAYKLTNGMFDVIIANSQTGARFNARALGINEDKYRVIYNGVDTERFKPRPMLQQREKFGIDPDVVLIGMFASFKQQKNHPFLFEAITPMLETDPRIRLLLVGDMLHGGMHGSDEYHTHIQSMINSTRLKDHCVLLGNRDDVEQLYPACNFTVLPSLFEGTPNVILESMACGIPVIATRVSDNDSIVSDGESGLLVDPGDIDKLQQSLTQMIRDPRLTSSMGLAARQRILDLFSSGKLAQNTQAVYDELTNP